MKFILYGHELTRFLLYLSPIMNAVVLILFGRRLVVLFLAGHRDMALFLVGRMTMVPGLRFYISCFSGRCSIKSVMGDNLVLFYSFYFKL